ncbi:hypothetical protein NU08_1668 [Flavobacterium anhuiense]|uniref:Uncharacterized protein n=1 Tax=Flavobacterium anhuiense TaxID=459526 RepID=A0A444W0D9_9FLAO|nr:hypothetical protein NU08_1668 [Flavobacterium anhuiense]
MVYAENKFAVASSFLWSKNTIFLTIELVLNLELCNLDIK